jgi:hypothetical protein
MSLNFCRRLLFAFCCGKNWGGNDNVIVQGNIEICDMASNPCFKIVASRPSSTVSMKYELETLLSGFELWTQRTRLNYITFFFRNIIC